MLKVLVKGFALDQVTKSPIILLEAQKLKGVLPIWIGPGEASAIAVSHTGTDYERPLPHDLLRLCLDGFGIKHLRTEITGLAGNTFHARMWLLRENEYVSLDCRPSDGIAVALRSKADIFVDKTLFESQKQMIDSDELWEPEKD